MTISPSECRNMALTVLLHSNKLSCSVLLAYHYVVYLNAFLCWHNCHTYNSISCERKHMHSLLSNHCCRKNNHSMLSIFVNIFKHSVRIFVLLKWTYPCSVHSYFLWTVLFLWKLMFLWMLLFLWTIMLMWTLMLHWLLLFLWTHVDAYVSADAVVILNSIVPVNASVPLNAIVHVNPVIPVNASFLWTLVSQWTQ